MRLAISAPWLSWIWYLSRFDGFSDKLPNTGHHSLRSLEEWAEKEGKRFTLKILEYTSYIK